MWCFNGTDLWRKLSTSHFVKKKEKMKSPRQEQLRNGMTWKNLKVLEEIRTVNLETL